MTKDYVVTNDSGKCKQFTFHDLDEALKFYLPLRAYYRLFELDNETLKIRVYPW